MEKHSGIARITLVVMVQIVWIILTLLDIKILQGSLYD